MTNKAENPQLDAAVIEARGKVETFFEKHGKSILWGLFIVACACVIYFIWSSRSERNSRIAEQNASVALVAAYDAIGMGDYETAAAEAVKVASEYEGTDAANLASYIAGASSVSGTMRAAISMVTSRPRVLRASCSMRCVWVCWAISPSSRTTCRVRSTTSLRPRPQAAIR